MQYEISNINLMQNEKPCNTDQTAINVLQKIMLSHVECVSSGLITRITGVCRRLNMTIAKHFSLTTSFASITPSIGPIYYSKDTTCFSSRGLYVFHNGFDEMLVHFQRRS
jgi:hypothetical protein